MPPACSRRHPESHCPVALLLLDVYPLRRRALGWRRLVAEKVPYLALAGAAAVVAIWAVRRGTVVTSYGEYGVGARLAMTAYSLVFYPWKWLWPAALSPLYELPATVNPLASRFLVPLLVVPALTAVLVVFRRRWPAGLAVWLYSCLMILPVSGVIHSGFQLAHDRYTYLSGLGLAVLAGGALVAVLRAGAEATAAARPRGPPPRHRRPRGVGPRCRERGGRAVSGGTPRLSGAGPWISIQRAPSATATSARPSCTRPRARRSRRRWRSRTFAAPSRFGPSGRRPTTTWAGRWRFKDALAEAEVAFKEFRRLSPRVPEAPGRLGMLYVEQQRYGEAIPLLREALAMEPRFAAVRADLVLALHKRAEILRRERQRSPRSGAGARGRQGRGRVAVTTRRIRWRRLALLTGLAVLTVVAFLPALDGQFLNWDDEKNLVTNEGYRGLGWAQLRWMLTTTLMGHWIPLTWLTLGVNYVVGGMAPWGYHVGNVLLHAANAVVFYAVARRLLAAGTGARDGVVVWGAVGAAAVFAVHPLRVESVAWVTERRDVLSGLFFLLAVLSYLIAVERGAGGGLDSRWRGGSLGLFAAALLSKGSTMMLPAVLLLLDVYPLGRRARGLRALVGEKIGYFALSALAGSIAVLALRSGGWAMTSYGDVGLFGRLALMTYSFTFYPWRWLWPVGLSPMYELPVKVNPFEWQFLLPLAAFPAITAALYALRRRWPAGLAAWVYSALIVLPVSGAAHAGFQLAADRYSYLSGLGFAALAGGAVILAQEAADSGRLRRGLAAALMATAVVVVVVLGAGAWRQSRVWHDSETLWAWAVSVDPACALCRYNLGQALLVAHAVEPGSRAAGREALRARDRAPARAGRFLQRSRDNTGAAGSAGRGGARPTGSSSAAGRTPSPRRPRWAVST